MAKKVQAKFYVEADKLTRAAAVFDRQGVTFTEGMTRLIDLLNAVPGAMVPVLLRQVPGDAAKLLAEMTLKSESFDPDSLKVTSTAQGVGARAPYMPGQQLGQKRRGAAPASRAGQSK